MRSFCKTVKISLFLLLLSHHSFASPSRSLTIFAEPNMVLPLTKITRLFSQKTNTIVSVNFDSSRDLMNDLDSGEPVDVFISAHPELIDMLHQKGLVDVHNAGYVASDDLVLVTNLTNPQFLPALQKNLPLEEALKILDESHASLVTDYEGGSSGKFAKDFLRNYHFEHLKFFNKIAEDKSPILSKIKNNNELYALLLKSQIKNEPNFLILSTKSNPDIFYQALVIAGNNMDVAREFVKFLRSDIAKNYLKESGFGVTSETAKGI